MKNTNQGSQVGFIAPDFTLPEAPGKNWTLSQTLGRPRVLVYIPMMKVFASARFLCWTHQVSFVGVMYHPLK